MLQPRVWRIKVRGGPEYFVQGWQDYNEQQVMWVDAEIYNRYSKNAYTASWIEKEVLEPGNLVPMCSLVIENTERIPVQGQYLAEYVEGYEMTRQYVLSNYWLECTWADDREPIIIGCYLCKDGPALVDVIDPKLVLII